MNPDKTNLQIREDKNGIYVEDLTTQKVRNLNDVLMLLEYGNRSRTMAQTKYNNKSSRSHTVFIIHVEKTHRRTGKMNFAKFTCCDLAGSERPHKTSTDGTQLEEAKFINLSLSALGNVIAALAHNQHNANKTGQPQQSPVATTFIPWRDSKLSRLLQDTLSGNSRISLIINIHPDENNIQETVTSLMFGQRAMAVNVRPKVNYEEEINYRQLVLELQQKIEDLHQMRDEEIKKLLRKNESLSSEMVRTISELEKAHLTLREKDDHQNHLRSTIREQTNQNTALKHEINKAELRIRQLDKILSIITDTVSKGEEHNGGDTKSHEDTENELEDFVFENSTSHTASSPFKKHQFKIVKTLQRFMTQERALMQEQIQEKEENIIELSRKLDIADRNAITLNDTLMDLQADYNQVINSYNSAKMELNHETRKSNALMKKIGEVDVIRRILEQHGLLSTQQTPPSTACFEDGGNCTVYVSPQKETLLSLEMSSPKSFHDESYENGISLRTKGPRNNVSDSNLSTPVHSLDFQNMVQSPPYHQDFIQTTTDLPVQALDAAQIVIRDLLTQLLEREKMIELLVHRIRIMETEHKLCEPSVMHDVRINDSELMAEFSAFQSFRYPLKRYQRWMLIRSAFNELSDSISGQSHFRLDQPVTPIGNNSMFGQDMLPLVTLQQLIDQPTFLYNADRSADRQQRREHGILMKFLIDEENGLANSEKNLANHVAKYTADGMDQLFIEEVRSLHDKLLLLGSESFDRDHTIMDQREMIRQLEEDLELECQRNATQLRSLRIMEKDNKVLTQQIECMESRLRRMHQSFQEVLDFSNDMIAKDKKLAELNQELEKFNDILMEELATMKRGNDMQISSNIVERSNIGQSIENPFESTLPQGDTTVVSATSLNPFDESEFEVCGSPFQIMQEQSIVEANDPHVSPVTPSPPVIDVDDTSTVFDSEFAEQQIADIVLNSPKVSRVSVRFAKHNETFTYEPTSDEDNDDDDEHEQPENNLGIDEDNEDDREDQKDEFINEKDDIDDSTIYQGSEGRNVEELKCSMLDEEELVLQNEREIVSQIPPRAPVQNERSLYVESIQSPLKQPKPERKSGKVAPVKNEQQHS